jgi:hypothetical protein
VAVVSGRGAALGLGPLAIQVDGDACTLDGRSGRLVLTPGIADDAVCLRLPPATLDDLVAERRTTLGLLVAGDVVVEGEAFDTVACWDHVLRALLDGRAVHETGAVEMSDAAGAPLDLGRSFTPDDDDAEIAHFLHEAGYLHLQGWVEPALLPAVAADIERAAEASQLQDAHRWWAKLENGERVCVRVQQFLDVSETMTEIMGGPAYERLARLSPDGHGWRRNTPTGVEALRKLPGVVEGLADFPWHRDCSIGGHPFECASLSIGLAVDGANAQSGQLSVLAGSHCTGLPSTRAGRRDIELARVTIKTEPGDLTVHLSCTLHMTRPPRTQTRNVVYSTLHLPEREGDRPITANPAYEKAASSGRA